jgi:hypothetical protein
MAWIEVTLINETFRSDDDNGTASARRVFLCRADAVVTSAAALSASFGPTSVPAANAPFSAARPLCRVTGRDVKHVSPRIKEVTVAYSDPTDGSVTSPTNLLSLPARISRRTIGEMEEYTLDASSPPKPVRNASGEPFERGPERRARVVLYTIRKYVTPATANQAWPSLFTTNEGAKIIKGNTHAAGTLALADLQDEDVDTGIIDLTVAIEYRPGGFKDVALNVGYEELVSGKRTPIKNSEGSLIARPWPLNVDGTKKATPDADIDTLEFKPFAPSSWAGVPLA